MKKIKVKIITAKGCKACNAAKQLIAKAAEAAGRELDLVEIDADDKAAIALAESYRLDSVPAFVINGHGFNGAKHVLKKVQDAIDWGK
jgi:thioredoxin-like negative regulator of GroEL